MWKNGILGRTEALLISLYGALEGLRSRLYAFPQNWATRQLCNCIMVVMLMKGNEDSVNKMLSQKW